MNLTGKLQQQQKSAPPDGAVLLQLFVLLFSSLFLFILNFIEITGVLRACRASQSRPVFPVRMQRLGVARSVGVSAPSMTPARGAATQSPLHRALRRN